MESSLIKRLYRQPPDGPVEVRVQGWVRTIRESKTTAFIELNDGSFFKNLQVVLDEAHIGLIKQLGISEGASLDVSGTLVPTPELKQPFELQARDIALVGACPIEYPLQKKRHSPEYLRTIAHLRPRTNLYAAVFRIRSLMAQAVHRFFEERNFVYVHTPIITCSDCEGAGEMFHVTTLDMENPPRADGKIDYAQDFFGKPAGLTVSGQLNAEALAMAFRSVYTFGPTFRAEKSNTPRHAAEFWMLEPEIAFADLDDDCRLAEDMVKYLIADLLEKAPEEMSFLDQFVEKGLIARLTAVRDAEFARVTYTEAIELLKKAPVDFEYPVEWGCDLQTEHERFLSERTFQRPVFVTDYPKEIKAFYMRLNDDGKTVAATDLLVPGVGEMIGGSQREDRADVLEARMRELDLDPEDYWWYMELRKFGGCPHAGFGLGFERFIMYVTGVTNIRDVSLFPRVTKSAEF